MKLKEIWKKYKPPKRTLKEWLVVIWQYIKRPAFFLPFLITYLLIMAPTYVCAILYFITKENHYWIIASSWYVLTAPPLPIPVVPISIGSGLLFERLINRKRNKK